MYHAYPTLVPGGFVGVDIFFVISGYLITSILLNDLNSNKFNLLDFYEKRARRILPVLLAVSATTIPLAWYLMDPPEFISFSESFISVGLFVSNFYFSSQVGYFGIGADTSPLLHTWSLAVEEQFYILFPLWLSYQWGKNPNFLTKKMYILLFIGICLAELGWRVDGQRSFFLTHYRYWELIAGSLCAALQFKKKIQGNDVIGTIGVSLLFLSIYFFNYNLQFPSLLTLIPVGGTVLVIVFSSQQTFVGRFLSYPPFVFI